jgi:uncharacterized protein (TIGR02996 family)
MTDTALLCWRTSNVLALCRQMRESRDFTPLPILADALQDAGCENAAVLGHCRSNAEPWSWVVSLMLGETMRAVVEGRDEDFPRLVWADEAGGERGEFVRVQCELARHDPKTEWIGDPETGIYGWEKLAHLRRRERDLLGPHYGWQWLGGDRLPTLPDGTQGVMPHWVWRRGFINAFICTAAD